MPRILVARKECKSCSARDVADLIIELNTLAPSGNVVYVEAQDAGDIGAGALFVEKLTDGSEVYIIQLL